MSNTADIPDPIEHSLMRTYYMPETDPFRRGSRSPVIDQDYLPEQDLTIVASTPPEGFMPAVFVPPSLDAAGYTESDQRHLTQDERDKALAEALRVHRASDIRHQTLSGRTAQDLLDAEQRRLLRGIGQDPDTSQGLETPTSGVSGDAYWDGIAKIADRFMEPGN
jgi:hypothetical protein